MLIAAAMLWFVTVIIPTAICRGIGHLSRPPERPQLNYDFWRGTYLDDEDEEDEDEEKEDEEKETERETADSRSVPHVYYEDDKDFVFPRIKVK